MVINEAEATRVVEFVNEKNLRVKVLDTESRDVPYDLTLNQEFFEHAMPLFVSRQSECSEEREQNCVFSGSSSN